MPASTLIDLLLPVCPIQAHWTHFQACAALEAAVGYENIWCLTHDLPALPPEEYALLLHGYGEASTHAELFRLKGQPPRVGVCQTGLGCEAERTDVQLSCVFVDRRTLPQFAHLDPSSPQFDRYDAHLISTMDHECG